MSTLFQALRWLAFKCKTEEKKSVSYVSVNVPLYTKVWLCAHTWSLRLSPFPTYQWHRVYCAWSSYGTYQTFNASTTVNLKTNISLWFWLTCNLERKSRSSNLVWVYRLKVRLKSYKAWKTSLWQCPQKGQCWSFWHTRKHVNYLPWKYVWK